jgi:RNA polymerase sigma-70 factor, ECF subfamily
MVGVSYAQPKKFSRGPNLDGPIGVYTSVTVELEQFVGESYGRAYRTACLILRNPADAEEAVQEAYLRAWRFRDAVRGDALGPWLYRVLVNTCYSKARDDARRPQVADSADGTLDALVSDITSPEQSAVRSDAATAVRRALQSLPDSLRVAVVLRYFAGLSEKEIATVIRRRPGTVKSRLHEARRRLAADPALAVFAEEAVQ